MNERRLREELRQVPIDDGARARALHVVRAAYRDRDPIRGRRRWAPALAVAGCLLAAGVIGVSATEPGDAVARWVRDVLGAGRHDARPTLVRVPGGGRLLVTTADAWVVASDGSRRRLGDYAGASWSPHGRFVIAWRGGELRAVEPGGRVRWALARSGVISAARWAPVDGFRIAYLSGRSLRVVNGDGTGDRRVGPASAGAPPAWRADDDHVLAYVDRRHRVRAVSVDSRRELWRSGPLPGVTELAWAPDGARLLVATPRGRLLFGRDGLVLARTSSWQGRVTDDVAWAPGGRRIAVVRRDQQRSTVLLADPAGRGRARVLFTGPGRFGRVAFSPDGRRLLVPWPQADQWLFLSTRRDGRVAAVSGIGRQFARSPGRPRFPDAVEWCCAGS